ncbi:MAG: 2-thiouracil desulfurase family protein [Candidatus Flemingiibacterium sp.]
MKNTTLCYIERGGRYLMLHRVKKSNDENHDKWIGIGGHFEPGESPYDCAVREIQEETSLEVRPEDCSYRGIVTFCSPEFETEQMHLFKVTEFSGEPGDCDEGVLEWLPIADVYSLPIWEGDRIFLRLLETDAPFFSLKLSYSGTGELLSSELHFSSEKKPLLVSACLLGAACRYDGESKPLPPEKLAALRERYQLIPVCPEQLGGLPTPRLPCELKDGRAVRSDGADLTAEYSRGADETLKLAKALGAGSALLKAKSPSCGSGRIYDGSFSGVLTDGDGITAALLRSRGIEVFSELEL